MNINIGKTCLIWNLFPNKWPYIHIAAYITSVLVIVQFVRYCSHSLILVVHPAYLTDSL